MDKLYKQWEKQLDDFDAATRSLPELEHGVRAWGALAPAVPALFDALMKESASYQRQAHALREWIGSSKEGGDPAEFGVLVRATIEEARRLKGVIDAFTREKTVAEAYYPEMAGGSLKDTPLPTPAASLEPGTSKPGASQPATPNNDPRHVVSPPQTPATEGKQDRNGATAARQ